MGLSLTLKSWLPKTQSNESLMQAYAHTADSQLLSQLYDNCNHDLYHFLLSLSQADMAKDLAQRTWLKVMEKRNLYQTSGHFRAWLFSIGRNLLIDDLRQQQRLQTLDDSASQQLVDHASAFINSEQHDLASAFDQALLALPFAQREAFCLQQEGFSLQQIANIVQSEPETVKSRLRYAKNQLRSRLEKYHA